MTSPSTDRKTVNRLRKEFCDSGQGHVFDWWDDLSTEERDNLIRQLSTIDLELMNRLATEHLGNKKKSEAISLEPAPFIPISRTTEEKKKARKAAQRGEELIREGKTAVFVVAGGQSSRLGLDIPKGEFPIMPVSGKSLFQHHSEKILALSRRHGVSIPFFVMTSQANQEETRSFFERNDYFGLLPKDVFFTPQGMLPAIDFSGKLALKGKGTLFMSPDGHGGSLKTLFKHGAVDEMEQRGVQYLFYFQVDNPLVKILDPVFLGYHDLKNAEMSSKIVEKKDPEEKVGVLGRINGRPGVIEYSDLGKDQKYARDSEGRLRFSAGSIAIHLLNVSFIRKYNEGGFNLPYHKAEKKIPYLDETGAVIKPEEPNGIKFETFVFDALSYATDTLAMEVLREEEFAPVKNAEGEDSPETSRRAITAFYRSWLHAAGFETERNDSEMIEISPLFALDGEEFKQKAGKRKLLFTSKLFIQ